ncbi:MAG: hypothetical protein IPM95_16115 [Sphingobacteriales bacterium]|nr:hypothetical protein [Sphingobacteriales bacterium]
MKKNLLVKYISIGSALKDSMLIIQDNNRSGVEAYFTFGRRVFKNETILDPGQQITQSSTNPLSSQMADVVYTDNNIAGFVTGNDTVSITYYDELDYQKGINAIPAGLPMLRHFRLLELNDMTSTKLYSKLIKSVRFKNFSSINNLFINNYDYTFDAQGRITEIRDESSFGTIGFVFSSSTKTRTISYK